MSNTQLTPTEIMTLSPIMPVIQIDDVKQAIPLAQALIEGGIKCYV